MWFLFQSGIIVATVQSNISWRWAERTAHAVLIGAGLAWFATVVTQGHLDKHALKGGRPMKPLQTKRPGRRGHLATATFWIGLLSLCGWGASAQIPQPPRPPLPIPNVVALMPPTAPLLRSAPTPIPPPAPERAQPTPAMMPIMPRVALPPVEFDHAYAGKLTARLSRCSQPCRVLIQDLRQRQRRDALLPDPVGPGGT